MSLHTQNVKNMKFGYVHLLVVVIISECVRISKHRIVYLE